MTSKGRSLLIVISLGLGLALVMAYSAASSRLRLAMVHEVHAQSGTDVIRVSTTGSDVPGCGGESHPCATVQFGVDQALPGDEVHVAAGVYDDVNTRGGLTQVVYLSKTVTIRGGYTTTNWLVPDPLANPTTLHAGGQGRVLYANGAITVTVEGLNLTGGDATGLGGSSLAKDAGGGVFAYAATVTVRNCMVYSNMASSTQWAYGGGLYLWGTTATLDGNTIVSNTAGTTTGSYGGGVYLDKSTATLTGNRVQGNIASRDSEGFGGGIYLLLCNAELADNLVQDNTASVLWSGDGGGLYLFRSEVILKGNTVRDNTASEGEEGRGGGMHLCTSHVTLSSNTIVGNTASTASTGSGGGLSFCMTNATLNGNTIVGNIASTAADGFGGGLSLLYDPATSSGTLATSHPVAVSLPDSRRGEGLWTADPILMTMTNNLVARNHAATQGGGLWFDVEDKAANSFRGRLLHNTIADNAASSGNGQGIYIGDGVTLALANTIIAGHPSAGIVITAGNTVTLEATLWYANGVDTAGRGTVLTGTVNVYDDPSFVNATAWDYHLSPDSAALDRGINAGVRTDIDNRPRPYQAPDLGADEYWPPGALKPVYLPLVMRPSL